MPDDPYEMSSEGIGPSDGAHSDSQLQSGIPLQTGGFAQLLQHLGHAFEDQPEDYRILGEIGDGGMGKVFLAQRLDQKKDTGKVALKVIHPRWVEDADFFHRRFDHERIILATLKSHPNIVHLEDAGTTSQGYPFFATEYIDGKPIDKYCNENRLAIDERLRLFLKVCDAVQYAHERTIVHRDIKPNNILVTKDGTPKLLDFGLAKLLAAGDRPDSVVVLPGFRFMTLAFASPEQVESKPALVASDIYSLGVVLYSLLTGRLPYRLNPGTLDEQAVRIICEQEPVPASEMAASSDGLESVDAADRKRLQRKLRGDLDNIVQMALRKQPERRYATVDKFAQDIRAYLSGLPVAARTDTLAYRAGKYVRRNWIALTTAAAFAAMLAIGTTMVLRNAAMAERRANDVRALANSLVFELHDAVADLPGATRARELIVSKGLNYLDKLAKEASGNPSLQLELAGSYMKIGDVQGNPNDANKGDVQAGLASYEKALAICESIPRSRTLNEALDQRLSAIHQRIGEVLLQTGRSKDALKHHQLAVAVMKPSVDGISASDRSRLTLAAAYIKLGETLESMGRPQEALEQYRNARTIIEALYKLKPDFPDARRYFTVICSKFGDVYRTLGNPGQALKEYRTALPVREAAAAANRNNATLQRDLATSYDRIAMTLADLGQVDEAVDDERKTLHIDEKLVLADPDNVDSQHDLANDQESLGQLYTRLEKWQDALPFHLAALALRERLALRAPQNQELQAEWAQANGFVATLQARTGARSQALKMCEKAIDIARKAYLVDSSNATFHELLANLYASAAEIAAMDARGRGSHDAIEWYRKSQVAYRELQAAGQLSGDGQAQLTKVNGELNRLTQ